MSRRLEMFRERREALSAASAAVNVQRDSTSEAVPTYTADDYYKTGKKAIEDIMKRNPNGEYTGKDAENFVMALRSLRVAAEKYQAQNTWDDAALAWHSIELAAQDPTIKTDAQTQKAYCRQQLLTPMRPR